jgi:putative endonuclease
MKRKYEFYVYIMASESGTLYTGFTNNLYSRVCQHKSDEVEGFTNKYQCHKLVYFEDHKYVLNAIAREKQIKKWNRKKKQDLIRIINPLWEDLAEGWYEEYSEGFLHCGRNDKTLRY